jgi:hypothetical protein
MTLPEILPLVLILLAAHFVYWHLALLLVLRRYEIPTISGSAVHIHPSINGDDVIIGGARYSGVKKGDVVFRPLHFLSEKKFYKVYWMRFLSLGTPGTSEHAAIYVGQGTVLNVNPNRRPSIHEQPLHEFIQGFDEQNLQFLRLSDQETTNQDVVDWIYWHRELEMQGKTGVIRIPMLRRKVPSGNPTPIGNSRFPYYVSGYNCNSLIQDAFTMAKVPGMDQLKNRFSNQVFSILGMLLFPSQRRIQYFLQSFSTSAKDLEGVAKVLIPSQVDPKNTNA